MNKSRNKTNRTVTVDINEVDQKRFNLFFKQELGFYNHVIGIFESRVRAFPTIIEKITPAQIELFGDCAMYHLNLNDFKTIETLPKELLKHKDTIFDRNTHCGIDPMVLMMFGELVKQTWVIDPGTKYRIAHGIMEFYRNQAEILSRPNKSELLEMTYRVPPTNLHKLDIDVKRHLQIPRKSIRYKYVHETNTTEIYTPYNTMPISIPEFNLHEVNGWNTLIIKQESGKHVDNFTPWLLEFKDTNNEYLLKYIDIGSKGKR